MPLETSSPTSEPKLRQVLRDDIRRGDLGRAVHRDYRDLREFFLDDTRRKKLAEMGRFRRIAYTIAWLLKSLFLKLTPARRLVIIVALAILLFFHSFEYRGSNLSISADFSVVAAFMILFVLMLELKDKLLARSELEAGRAVQTALMPERSPEVSGWSLWLFTRTANDVGGDLVDFQRLDDDRCRISLADVAGKGLSAALFTAKLQATIRAFAVETDAIDELVRKINRIFYRDKVPSMFASLVYLELNSNSNVIRLINAGHAPPMVVRNNSTMEEMGKGEPAIGILTDSLYTEQHVGLQQGDFFFLYSDGLPDAKNAAGEFFGLSRLNQLLPSLQQLDVPSIGTHVVNEVNLFVGDAPVHDDLSTVVIKRTA